jgi:hypothetical protein
MGSSGLAVPLNFECGTAYIEWRYGKARLLVPSGRDGLWRLLHSARATAAWALGYRTSGAPSGEEGTQQWKEDTTRLVTRLSVPIQSRPELLASLVAELEATVQRECRGLERALAPLRGELGDRLGCSGDVVCAQLVEAYDLALGIAAHTAAPNAAAHAAQEAGAEAVSGLTEEETRIAEEQHLLFASRTAADVMRCAASPPLPCRRLRPQLLTPASRPARACIFPVDRRIQEPAPRMDPDEEARIVEEQHLPPGAIHARVFGAGDLVNFWPPARGSRVEQGVVEAAVPLSSIQEKGHETGVRYRVRLETPPGAAPLANVFDDGRRLRLRFAPNAAAQAAQEAGAEAVAWLVAASSLYSEHAQEAAAQARLAQQAAPWEAHRAALRATLAAQAAAVRRSE